MGKKLKLTKIELETKDGKKISLSLDEAKDLHDQLHDLFGKKDTVYIPSSPLPPIIIERGRYPWRNPCTPYWRGDSIPLVAKTGGPVPQVQYTTCEVNCGSGLKIGYTGSTV